MKMIVDKLWKSQPFIAELAEEETMTKRNQHVVPHSNGWAVKGAGADRATSVHDTQKEAIDRARGVSRNQGTELLVHGRNGQIRERDSHGNDPHPPKG